MIRSRVSSWIRIVLVAILVSAGISLVGTGYAEASELKIGAALVPPEIDPHSDTAVIPTISFHNVFDALTEFDAKGTLLPALATSWKLVDPKTWEFKLRSGVQFHNGDTFTSEDVKFTFERAADKKNPRTIAVAPRIGSIERVEIVDDYTVRFHTSSPDPILDRKTSIVKMLPAGYFQNVGEKTFGTKPVGTGPYKVVSFTPGVRVAMEAAENSWQGRPRIDAIELVAIQETSVRTLALKAGDIDMAVQINPDRVEDLKSAGFTVLSGHLARVESVGINTWEGNDDYAILRDKRVRQALNYAVDKKVIVETIMQGTTEVANGQLVTEQAFGYNPELYPYSYDPERARALLAEAGHPNGFKIRMQTSQGACQSDREIAEIVVAYLKDVGITAELEVLEYSVFRELFYPAGKRAPLFYECWSTFPYLDADGMLFLFDSDHPGKRYANPAFDVLYRASRQEMDPKRREALLQTVFSIMRDDPSSVWLVAEPEIFALKSNVKGFTPRADAVIKMQDMYIE